MVVKELTHQLQVWLQSNIFQTPYADIDHKTIILTRLLTYALFVTSANIKHVNNNT